EDALGAGEGVGEPGAVAAQDPALVPGALVDELLEGLFGVLAGQARGQADAAGQGLDALALAVEQESLEVDAGPGGRFGLWGIWGESPGVVAEPLQGRQIKGRSVGLHTRIEACTLSRIQASNGVVLAPLRDSIDSARRHRPPTAPLPTSSRQHAGAGRGRRVWLSRSGCAPTSGLPSAPNGSRSAAGDRAGNPGAAPHRQTRFARPPAGHGPWGPPGARFPR